MDAHAAFELLVAQSWQVAALAVGAAAVAWTVGRNRPHLAHALWTLVLIKAIVPPVWSSQSSLFSWLQPPLVPNQSLAAPDLPSMSGRMQVEIGLRPEDAFAHDTVVKDAVAQEMLAQEILANDAFAKNRVAKNTVANDTAAHPGAIAGNVAVASIKTAEARGIAWSQTIVAIWLAGACALAMLGAVRSVAGRRRLRAQRIEHDPALDEALADCALRVYLRRRARVRVVEGRVGPSVFGLIRPTVVLPAAVVRGRSREALTPILTHELVHLRRGDLWTSVLSAAARCALWFHPAVWIAARAMARESERCTDEESIAALDCPPARYARTLLDVLEWKRSSTAVPGVPGMRAVDVTRKRLERIMQLKQGCRRRMPRWCWIVVVAVAAATLPGAAFEDEQHPIPDAKPALEPAQEANETTPAPADAVSAENPVQVGQSAPQDPFGRVHLKQPAVVPGMSPSEVVGNQHRVSDLFDRAANELGLSAHDAARHVLRRLYATILSGDELQSMMAHLKQADAAYLDMLMRNVDTLYWPTTEERHELLKQELARMRKYGFAQLRLRVRFGVGRPDEINSVSSQWKLLPTTIPDAEKGNNGHMADLPAPQWSGDEPQPGTASASVTVERSLPVLVEVMGDARRDQVVNALQSLRRVSVLTAPTVVVDNGQSATIKDCSYSPFVVGIENAKPQIRVVSAGQTFWLRPVLNGDQVRLDYDVEAAQIRSVDTCEVPGPDGRNVTLQSPLVEKARLRASATFPLGKSILVGGLQVDGKDGEAESTVIVVDVERVVPDVEERFSDVPAPADRSKDAEQEPRDTMAMKMYLVSDLVCPTLMANRANATAPIADFRPLVELIRTTIAPTSWDKVGGDGKIYVFPHNLSLVVRQTSEVHHELSLLLAQLRELQNKAATEGRLGDFEINCEQFRVAPGAGLRMTVPALGPATIVVDPITPVAQAPIDDIQNLSILVGSTR